MSINTVTLIGRLTRDPELTYTPSGCEVLKFSIAQNYKKNKSDGSKEDVAQFFDIVILGKYAETMSQYLIKGKQVGVTGKLRQQRWKDKDTGKGRSKIEILCNDLEMVGSKNEGSGNYNSQYEGEAGTKTAKTENIEDDDIPF